jgi:4-amino-4-deoxy-L-arabinose transferase-like glycosyltransferase
MHEATARRLLLAAVAVAFALRLAFGVIYWNGKPLTHDEREYLSLAGSVAAGRGFVYDESFEIGTGQQFGRAPGYPLFLAAIGAGSQAENGTPLRVKVAQSLIGAAVVLVIGLIARRAGGAVSAVVAAWIAALYPPLVALPSYVLSETLYSLLALTAVLALQAAVTDEPDNRRSLVRVAAAGALTAAAALIRPAMLFFVPLVVLWLAFRRQSAALLLFGAAVALVILPWTLRNVRVYGRPVLIASEGGVTFWTGNHPLATGEGDLAANPAIKAAELEFRRAHPGMSPEQLEPVYYSDALTYIRAHPVWWLRLVARKAFYAVVPLGPSYALHSARYRAASAAPYLVLLPFAAVGARRLWRGPRPPIALALLAGSALLVSLVFFPHPTLIVCASGLAGRPRL